MFLFEYDYFVVIAFLIAFGAWIMEMRNNRHKDESQRSHIACVLMVILFFLSLPVVCVAVLYLFIYLLFAEHHRPLEYRQATAAEIQQFQDKGIQIPQGSWLEINGNHKEIQRIYLTEEQSGNISWGASQFKELFLGATGYLSFKLTGMQGKSELPAVVEIDGRHCLTNMDLRFKRKNSQTIDSYRPDDYVLDGCTVANFSVQTPQGTLNLDGSTFFNINYNNMVRPEETETLQKFGTLETYYPVGYIFSLPVPNGKILLNEIYTDNQQQFIGFGGRFMGEYDDVIKIGECEYDPYVNITLTDLTATTAHWHFSGKDLAENCKMQVLPYKLVIEK
ncbi:hypothetical protein [Aggregatibacter kilianii]|uniref:hypothetical protein n=1 Tax=Aggregatibacter kilianii TaxID=2025884 RepID=UPI000D65BC42|nr:hypothetical protein [Aggregatibacter kilianii]